MGCSLSSEGTEPVFSTLRLYIARGQVHGARVHLGCCLTPRKPYREREGECSQQYVVCHKSVTNCVKLDSFVTHLKCCHLRKARPEQLFCFVSSWDEINA
ncbi:gamma-aminobutyric acid receptor-associated protein-like 2 [Platysternon megacephalum]|uniref:Gamma-aminobutyric acid receptor-associated protein-like 2 n=1 Tax=Platysternon megacephalum TaxID=55544 RepID=A0A4D9EA77_9SAUR|nr:gamma-aminobutyric acid receptor-associated protein-like 2 [Platysternon megacephalum]